METFENTSKSLIGKTILIFSPQRWNHIFVSKHHYAMALAKMNTVFFVEPPILNVINSLQQHKPFDHIDLTVIKPGYPLPLFTQFYLPKIYMWFYKKRIRNFILHLQNNIADLIIDFGCLKQFDSLNSFPARHKIFFPVDDQEFLYPDKRGADIAISVSTNICKKFSENGLKCLFINHGLSEPFTESANKISSTLDAEIFKKKGPIKIGYAGNMLIPFIDRQIMKKIFETCTDKEFHIFGNFPEYSEDKNDQDWLNFLLAANNVFSHGMLTPEKLVAAYSEIDAFFLCYKPNHKNYHAENSHKIIEYLSTGKPVFSSYISLYENKELLIMAPKNRNEKLVELINDFNRNNIGDYYNDNLINTKIKFALSNTYMNNVRTIASYLFTYN